MKPETEKQLVTDVNQALKNLEYDVTQRNQEIDKREKYLYGNGLWSQIKFDLGQWFAEYNYLKRVVNIHSSQLMGRGFNVYSYYNKEDLTPYEDDPQEKQLAILRNKKLKANADMRKKVVDAIIRDNGGIAKFKDGARIGSAFGTTIYKMWYSKKDKKVNISLLESPQNYRAGWTDGDFRERDYDAYVYQISVDKAYRDYGKVLKEGEKFTTSKYGEPFTLIPDDSRVPQTVREMVTVVDFTGYLPEWDGNNKVKRGDEKRFSTLIVGGHVAETNTDEATLPKYYLIQNRQEPRRAWGSSDLPQSALDINQEIVQLEADCMTWANKSLFKKWIAHGFTEETLPKFAPRKTQVIASPGQESRIEEVQHTLGELQSFRSLIEAKMEAFVRVTEVGRVLFDDPTVDTNSNQALMTTMKPVIDIVEDKQSRWTPALTNLFTDALKLAATDMPQLKEAISAEEDWFLCIEYPSVLRREDSSFQAMWLNRVSQGLVSLETYMEKMGDDYTEEMDRLRDEMTDKTSAAVLAHELPLLAQGVITPPSNVPAGPDVRYNVQVKADSSLDPNMNAAVINEVMTGQEGPVQQSPSAPTSQPGPIINPDQNTESTAPVSTPGSGQPTAVSPEGAVAQTAQNSGA